MHEYGIRLKPIAEDDFITIGEMEAISFPAQAKMTEKPENLNEAQQVLWEKHKMHISPHEASMLAVCEDKFLDLFDKALFAAHYNMSVKENRSKFNKIDKDQSHMPLVSKFSITYSSSHERLEYPLALMKGQYQQIISK